MTDTMQSSTTYPQPVHAAGAAREELSLRIFDLADALTEQAKAVRSIAEHVEAGRPLQHHDGATFTAAEAVAWVAEALEAVTKRADLSALVRDAATHDVAVARATEANWLIGSVERDYVSALNAVLASPAEAVDDRQRWRGQAEAYHDIDRAVRARHSFPAPMLRNRGWRELNGVYSDADIAGFRHGHDAQAEAGRDTAAGVFAAGPDDLTDLAADNG